MTIAYGTMLALAVAVLVLYCALIRNTARWLIGLYVFVPVVNLGYLLLSISTRVEFALFANKITYLGHIFLLISMYLAVVRLCGFKPSRWLPIILISLGVVMFAIVCTSGHLPWFYGEVWLERVDGAARLVKEYGPLHSLYLVYVLSYFVIMALTIAFSILTKRVVSGKQAGLLVAVVLCNIFMWLIEKVVPWNFEFLSVSYVLSEGMIFFLYWMMQDYVHKNDLPVAEPAVSVVVVDSMNVTEKMDRITALLPGGETLAPREVEVLELVLLRRKRKEIAAQLNLSENTVKTYTRSLYNKLGVSSRDELYSKLD